MLKRSDPAQELDGDGSLVYEPKSTRESESERAATKRRKSGAGLRGR